MRNGNTFIHNEISSNANMLIYNLLTQITKSNQHESNSKNSCSRNSVFRSGIILFGQFFCWAAYQNELNKLGNQRLAYKLVDVICTKQKWVLRNAFLLNTFSMCSAQMFGSNVRLKSSAPNAGPCSVQLS